MANKNDWCFGGGSTPEENKDSIEAFKAELESIHAQYTQEAWADQVEPMNLTDHDLGNLVEKPPKATEGVWWELTDPDCWKPLKDVFNKYDNEAVFDDLEKTVDSNLQVSADDFGAFESEEARALALSYAELQQVLKAFVDSPTGFNRDVVPELEGIFAEVGEDLLAFRRTLPRTEAAAEALGEENLSIIGKFNTLTDNQELIIQKIDYIFELREAPDVCPSQEEIKSQYYLPAIQALYGPEKEKKENNPMVAAVVGALLAPLAAPLGLGGVVAGATPLVVDALAEKTKEEIEEDEKEIKEAFERAQAGQVIFQEQCFVLANLGELVNHKKELPPSLPLPYVATTEIREGGSKESVLSGNTPINIQGSAFAFVNKLAVHPFTAELFDLKEEEISSLTPRMRFFKVDSGDDGSDVETEITFDNNITKESLESYLKSGGRGIGVGVNSFDFSYDGTDPFSAKKAISAKLSIYATSFSDLLELRPGGYSYVDLALKTGRNVSKKTKLTEIEKLNIDKLNFRLKAVVEWVAEKKEMRMLRPKVKNAVYNSAISFYLTPTIHEFDFDETGAVNFTINYLAYIEDYFAQPQFDVFASTTADKQARDLVYDYYRQKGCDISTDEFSELRTFDENYITKINSIALQSIVNSLRKQQKIYYISISKEEMKDWLKSPTKNDYIKTITNTPTNTIETNMVNAAANKAKSNDGEEGKDDIGAYRLSLVANSDLRQNIAIFYLSDLVSVVLKNIEDALIESENVITSNYYEDVISKMKQKSEIDKYIKKRLTNKTNPKFAATLKQFEKMRIVLGPMEVTPYGDLRNSTPSVSCTLGDIPISLNYFLDFMSEKVLSNDFIKYPLSKFIKDMINDCIKNFLNSSDCFRSNASQKISLNSTTVLGYNTLPGDADDDLSNLIIGLKDTSASSKNCLLLNQVDKKYFPILKISGPNDSRTTLSINTMRNYYIFSAGKRYPTDLYAGNKSQDAEHGIFHYLLGANTGIVKNISLDKTSTPGLKELRFEQEGFDGLEQLREVYNANITTFLNPQTFPGTYIYVEPRGFDPKATEDLTRFGIGGYYMIVKTSHSIKPGDAETTLNAAWVASKGGKAVKATSGTERDKRDVKEGSEQAQKCLVKSVFKTDIRGTN